MSGLPPSKRKRIRLWGATFGILSAVCVAGFVATGSLSRYVDARAARRLIASGELERARDPLERWIKADPDDAEAYFLRAQIESAGGRSAEAFRDLDRSQWLGFAERPIYRLRALILVRLGRFFEAEPILLHLLDESSHPDPQADEALTRIFLETYRLENAIAFLNRWVRDAPRDPKPYLWWTEIDERPEVDNPEAMERHFRMALSLDPNLDRARLGLANTLRRLHRFAEAVLEYSAYLARRPHEVAGYIGLAQIARQQGDEAAALGFAEQALRIDSKSTEVQKLLAAIEIRRGNDAAALRYLDRAIESAPLDLESMYNQSLALTRLGRKEEASQVRQRVEQLRKDQAAVLRIRDRILSDPRNNQFRYEMAQWMMEHGREDEAIRWLRQILAGEPKHLPSLRLMAEYYIRRKEVGLANYYQLLADQAP